MSRKFLMFFVAELLVIAAVTIVFKLIHERVVAGAVAGTIFVALGAWIVITCAMHWALRRTATMWVACVHLFLVAIPLMVTRLIYYSSAFGDVRVWGIPGPIFHSIATGIYVVLMSATILDFVRFKRGERAKLQK